MKNAAQTKRQPSKESAKAARPTTPVRRAVKETRGAQAEAPRTAAKETRRVQAEAPRRVTKETPVQAEAARTVAKETPRVQAEAPRAVSPDGNGNSPMPDLSAFGVEQRDAQAHVGQCEPCGRAYRHVVKNPRDAMALESFGRHIASCLAGNQKKSA